MRNYQWLIFHVVLAIFVGNGLYAQDPRAQGLTKEEYYNLLQKERGLPPLPKPSAERDRKRSVLDIGAVEARIQNSAILGYDRWGKCYEYPARSGITYRWTMGPVIGALKKDPATGTFQKLVAVGTLGAFRKSEGEYQPLPGFDAGFVDESRNIGIAFSDIPASWPAQWPSFDQLPEHARRVQYQTPRVGSKGFPGILDGEVVAPREAYFVVTDNDPEKGNKPAPLDIRVDVWGLQYDDVLNRNFIIFKFLLTNIGTDTLYDAYIGMHDDPDAPEQGAAEWTDDYAAFIRVGDDVPGYIPKEDTLLWNFTYLWDGDDKAEGFIPRGVGWVGLKFLETPTNPNTGQPTGVTAFRVFEYSAVAQGDEAEYDDFTKGIQEPNNVTPHPKDWTQTPNSYGPDITYVVGSGPFTLAPGESLPFAFATIHGANKRDLFNGAMLCQLLYDANYQSAEPPPEPKVTAVAGDKQVILYWDDRSAKGIYADGHVNDRLTGNNAFEGYKIYKSTDRGVTWGEKIFDVRGAFKYWRPLAQYDSKNEITGESQLELGRYFYLGDDTGLRHYYIDNNVNNGYEYWYAVGAYDHDDGVIPPLENSIKSNPYLEGDNTVAVVPAAPAAGFTVGGMRGNAVRVEGRSTIPFFPVTVMNPSQVTGDVYRITFDASNKSDKRYSVTNATKMTPVVAINGDTLHNVPLFDEALDTAPIFDGLRLTITDIEPGVREGKQTVPPNATRLRLDSWKIINQDNDFLDDDYEIRFTYSDSSWSASRDNHLRLFKVPFQVWNVRTNTRIVATIHNSGTPPDDILDLDKRDTVYLVNIGYDTAFSFTGPLRRLRARPTDYSYKIVFDTTSSHQDGDVFAVNTHHRIASEDVYEFETIAQTASSMRASNFAKITTVPNPFVVSSAYELLRYGVSKELQFHNLPPECTIRIYNIAGDHIATIYHTDGTPIARWNLQTYNGQEVSYGVYLFHVSEAKDENGRAIEGEYIGKFAVIK